MSKDWFLDVSTNEDKEAEEMRKKIESVLGRKMGDAGGIKKEADREGKKLENGEGVNGFHEVEQAMGKMGIKEEIREVHSDGSVEA